MYVCTGSTACPSTPQVMMPARDAVMTDLKKLYSYE